ncbi:MAG: pilus assembly FimT family protein [Acidiferrobacterales bacterium]
MGTLKKKQAGISILEILVVLIMVSVLVGTVGLSLNLGSDHQVRTSIDSLKQRIEALRENAILQNRLYTIVFSKDRYTIYVLDPDNQLVRLKEDGGLRSDRLPRGADFGEFRLDDKVINGEARLIIEPSTPLPAFRLAITNHKQTWWISNRPQEGLRVVEQTG